MMNNQSINPRINLFHEKIRDKINSSIDKADPASRKVANEYIEILGIFFHVRAMISDG